LCDFNEEFFTEKERIAMEEINRLGGIDKLADDLDKRMRKAEEFQQ